jgi:cellobiose-specific phosphotransferase system component IIB
MDLRQKSCHHVTTSLLCLVVLFLLGTMIACSSGMMSSMMVTRQLQSITVTPASATAQTMSNNQVQFSAMGHFNMNPMSGTPQVRWSIGNPFSSMPVPAGVTINANGLALCTTFVGTVTIQATAPMDPNMPLSQMSMMTSNVAGMAQLTCP